jgi:hypothetical protein
MLDWNFGKWDNLGLLDEFESEIEKAEDRDIDV